jgi:hypothetical protein
LALQRAQRLTMFAAKLVLSQSTGFKFNHQPLDFLSASPLTPRNSLDFSHPDITALKRGAD